MKVVHAVHGGTHAFAARSLEGGGTAIIVTTPYRPSHAATWPQCGKPTKTGPCRYFVADGGDGCLRYHREPA